MRYQVWTNKYSHEGSGVERLDSETNDLSEAIKNGKALLPHQRFVYIREVVNGTVVFERNVKEL